MTLNPLIAGSFLNLASDLESLHVLSLNCSSDLLEECGFKTETEKVFSFWVREIQGAHESAQTQMLSPINQNASKIAETTRDVRGAEYFYWLREKL
ncbi:hypothetical protein BK816_06245 [Boudabousia tangfeifanii]|uniref:Uncharacterized protein n=1 Tax=Boudabousia tangfeifanii TaxID=1912795 RepID=A0A1D9MLA6_9ACTO|nr:hypothetical protein BK816_06245 [Boudabousia tangfeifanii]